MATFTYFFTYFMQLRPQTASRNISKLFYLQLIYAYLTIFILHYIVSVGAFDRILLPCSVFSHVAGLLTLWNRIE